MCLIEPDWKAIEAVLTGWFAGDDGFMKLSLMDSHSYLAWHILHEQRVEWRVGEDLPPPPEMTDPDLGAKLKWFKKSWADWQPPIPGSTFTIRDLAKKINHAGSYGMGPKHLADLLRITIHVAIRLMKIKEKSAPKVAEWQKSVRRQAHTQGYLENPFGHRRAFWGVYEKKKDGTLGIGEEANKALAFLPQSTAAGMLRATLVDLYEEQLHGELRGGFLLVPIHDAILLEAPLEMRDPVARLLKRYMERPWPQLNDLSISVDPKWSSTSWAEMVELKL